MFLGPDTVMRNYRTQMQSVHNFTQCKKILEIISDPNLNTDLNKTSKVHFLVFKTKELYINQTITSVYPCFHLKQHILTKNHHNI